MIRVKMIRRSFVILLTTLTATLAAGRDIHTTRTFRLNGFTDGYYIELEYDSAIVSFGLQDVRDELLKLKSKRDYQGSDFQRYFSETLNDIRTERNYLFKGFGNYGAGIIEQYVLRTLISKGKSKILNKTANKYVDKVKRNHYRVSMSGESHEGYEFAFMNGTIFLVDRISI